MPQNDIIMVKSGMKNVQPYDTLHRNSCFKLETGVDTYVKEETRY